jgi:hypothetical protein
VGPFKLTERQVLLVFEGAIDVTIDEADPVCAQSQEVVSVPGETWRTITAVGDQPAEIAVLTAGDHKKHPVWPADLRARAAEHGIGVDHAGYLAPRRLLPV